jgi:hypothetical protein
MGNDEVNHPSHYAGQGKVECIDFMEACISQYSGIIAACLGNVIKYTWRWKNKGGLQDLRKAEWYYLHADKKIKGSTIGERDYQYNGKVLVITGVNEATADYGNLKEVKLFQIIVASIENGNFYLDGNRTAGKKAFREWIEMEG